MSKDNRLHYPKEPIIYDVIPNVWKTTGTMCGLRRDVDRITDKPEKITCPECGRLAREYWTEQKIACERLLQYAENGMLKSSSIDDPLPRLRTALGDAIHILAILPPVSREEW